jgi:hypothetical protein
MDIFRPEETGALVFSLDESGTIVSVFDKAINIRVSDRRLVSIVRHAAAMTPMSVLCPRLLDRGESFGIGQRVSFSTASWRPMAGTWICAAVHGSRAIRRSTNPSVWMRKNWICLRRSCISQVKKTDCWGLPWMGNPGIVL